MKQKTSLYRHFDSEGRLLYVGISINPMIRFTQHKAEKDWIDEVKSITIDQFNSRKDAIYAEKKAIESEKPKYNIVYNIPDSKLKKPQSDRFVSIDSQILSLYRSNAVWSDKVKMFELFIPENLLPKYLISGLFTINEQGQTRRRKPSAFESKSKHGHNSGLTISVSEGMVDVWIYALIHNGHYDCDESFQPIKKPLIGVGD